jgi:hypothetical protein
MGGATEAQRWHAWRSVPGTSSVIIAVCATKNKNRSDEQVYTFFISCCYSPERTYRSTTGSYVKAFQRDEATKRFVVERVSTPMVPSTT